MMAKQLISGVFHLFVMSSLSLSLEMLFPSSVEIMINEVSILPHVNETFFLFDSTINQSKNQYLLQHLTTMIDANDVEINCDYFTLSHEWGGGDWWHEWYLEKACMDRNHGYCSVLVGSRIRRYMSLEKYVVRFFSPHLSKWSFSQWDSYLFISYHERLLFFGNVGLAKSRPTSKSNLITM